MICRDHTNSLCAVLGLSVSEWGIPERHSGSQESSFSPRFPVWSPLLKVIALLVGAKPTPSCLGSSSHSFLSRFQKMEAWLLLSSHHRSISVVPLHGLLLSEAFLDYHVPSILGYVFPRRAVNETAVMVLTSQPVFYSKHCCCSRIH